MQCSHSHSRPAPAISFEALAERLDSLSPKPRRVGPRSSPHPPHVLVVTADRPLAETRAEILRMSGCSVVVATYQQARQFACLEQFHVVLICQSIAPSQASVLARELRRNLPAIRVVRVAFCPDGIEPGYDCVLTAPVYPWVLQDTILSAR